MLKLLPVLLLSLEILAIPEGVSASNLTGVWEAWKLGVRVSANVKQTGNNLSGVAYVYNLFGKRDTYHFDGSVQGDKVVGRHHDGMAFSGTITPQGHVEGILKTVEGMKIPISIFRK